MRDLLYFLETAKHPTFTQAAKAAHLSQPALTAAMQRLEREVNAKLFARGPKGTELTDAGRILFQHANAIVNEFEVAKQEIEELNGLLRGRVRIGAGTTAATYLLPPMLMLFRRKHPNIELQMREESSDALRFSIETGTLDLAIVAEAVGVPWRTDELIVVASPKFDTAIPLAEGPFVAFPRGGASRIALDTLFPRAKIVVEVASIASLKANVRAGLGRALLSRVAVERELTRGELVEIRTSTTPIRRQFRALYRDPKSLSPAARAFLQMLRENRV